MGQLWSLKDYRHKSLISLIYALGGGVFASLGTFVEELSFGGGFLLGVVLIGPLIEEVLKPIGIIILLEKDPAGFHSKTHILWLCALSALVFSLLENILYIYIYLDKVIREYPSFFREVFYYRYTVCVLLHISTTLILGLGLVKEFERIKENAEKFMLENVTLYIGLAVGIHGIYNLFVSTFYPRLF